MILKPRELGGLAPLGAVAPLKVFVKKLSVHASLFLTAMHMHFTVLWDVGPSSLVGGNQHC